jgi:type II secretory pathway pseudopilin PulG
MFVMIIAIMSILMGAAVEIVSFQKRRENEAELIFRGGQYVESIRLFRLRFGRYPMRLKEIWEADPKVIRHQFKDPITDSLDGGLIFVGEGQPIGAGGSGGAGADPTGTPGFGDRRGSFGDRDDGSRRSGFGRAGGREEGDRPGGGFGGRSGGERVGPIIGVHSTSCKQSIKVYEGRTAYCEWRFMLKETGEEQGGGRRGRRRMPTPTPENNYPFGTQPLPKPSPSPAP